VKENPSLGLQDLFRFVDSLVRRLASIGLVVSARRGECEGRPIPVWWITLHGGACVQLLARLRGDGAPSGDIAAALGIRPLDVEPGLLPTLRILHGRIESVPDAESPQ